MVETKNIKIVTSMEEKDFFFVVREKRKKKKRERKEKKGWLFSPVNNISISLFHWYFIIIHISISLLHRYFIGICDQVRMLIRRVRAVIRKQAAEIGDIHAFDNLH
ncbi:uncharacterized protein LOC122509188 isoform X2 [Leptopilina heterotoma]|uniref:uncharacterized protein LOC122509188 isoform X2 n=1 Tax=Leptopilina heterotoma TaxID=63436 RepID=UPI001CA84B47|nr:uncharacterized protein LOC122509188 isoform X2 [Leptopilina heterotoma]